MSHPEHTIRVFNEHIFVIGDLHLGDGTRSDLFSLGNSVTKRDCMRSLIKTVREHDGVLIINGDLMDLQQGWSIDRVITANAILFRELSDLGKDGKLIYIWSELDEDLSYYEELLNAQTASTVLILDEKPKATEPVESSTTEQTSPQEVHHNDGAVWAEIVQGFRFNPAIDPSNLSFRGKSLHHLVERLLGTWIRFPLENFPTLENKLFFWLLHKLDWTGRKFKNKGLQGFTARAHANQIGNPHQVWTELNGQLQSDEFTPQGSLLVMGHSHLPGKVDIDQETTLINTGSWIFDSQTVLHLETTSKQATLLDWASKDEITAVPYTHLTSTHPMDVARLDSSFADWWEQHYLGWLKFNFEHPCPSSSASTSLGDAT